MKKSIVKTEKKLRSGWVICEQCGMRFEDTIEMKADHIYSEHPAHFFKSIFNLLPRITDIRDQLTSNIRNSMK